MSAINIVGEMNVGRLSTLEVVLVALDRGLLCATDCSDKSDEKWKGPCR